MVCVKSLNRKPTTANMFTENAKHTSRVYAEKPSTAVS